MQDIFFLEILAIHVKGLCVCVCVCVCVALFYFILHQNQDHLIVEFLTTAVFIFKGVADLLWFDLHLLVLLFKQ